MRNRGDSIKSGENDSSKNSTPKKSSSSTSSQTYIEHPIYSFDKYLSKVSLSKDSKKLGFFHLLCLFLIFLVKFSALFFA